MNIQKYIQHSEGTTLIELLISLSIFAIFIAIAIGGFVQSIANQRILLKLAEATDNASLTLEQVTREVRVGTAFVTNGNGSILEFDRPDEDGGGLVTKHVRYEWDSVQKSIIRSVDNGTPKKMTADSIEISSFSASVRERQGESGPPYLVTLVIGVSASEKGRSFSTYLQTSMSGRVF